MRIGKKGSVKAIIRKDFWSLEGSLSSGIKLSDKELREARESFSKNLGKVQ